MPEKHREPGREGGPPDRIANTQFRQFADALPSVVWTCAFDGSVDFFNRRWYELTGQTAEEALGWGWLDAVHPDDREEVMTTCRNYLQDKHPHEMEQRYRQKDGEYVWYLVRALPQFNLDGEVDHWFGISTDIDDKYRAVYESRQHLALIHDAAQTIIYDADLLTGELMRNRRYTEQLGRSEGDPMAWWSSHIHPDDRERVTASLTAALRSAAIRWAEDYRFKRPDGSYAMIRDRAHIARNEQQEAVRLLGSMQDVTELVRLRQELKQAERLAVIGEMLSAIAHESRGALQRIAAGVDALRFEVDATSDAGEDLDGIARAKSDLQRLFEELQNYAAPLPLHLENSDIRKVWRRAWQPLQALREEQAVHLIEHPGEVDRYGLMDTFRLEQVFRNLMENALDACGDGARINLAVEEATVRGATAMEITLSDNGPGLPPEDVERVFDAFFTTKPEGTGLGMAISRRIVEAHHGSIQAQNRKEGGAAFVILLPRNPS